MHRTDASARSRKVAWSSRPRAAVYSGIVCRHLRPARSPTEGTVASAESASASAAPGLPVVPERSCGAGGSAAASADYFRFGTFCTVVGLRTANGK